MSDLVGNPNCWFSHSKAQIVCILDINNAFVSLQMQLQPHYITHKLNDMNAEIELYNADAE